MLNPLFDVGGFGTKTLECFSSPTQNIYPDSATSCRLITTITEENPEEEQVHIFPNPTLGQITISTNEDVKRIQVFNLQGQLMQNITLNNGSKTEFQLQGESGIYIIQLPSKDGTVQRRKVVKM